MMRVILSEDWIYPWYGQILLERIRELGIGAVPFKLGSYFQRGGVASISMRLQRKYRFGPVVRGLNNELLRVAKREQPHAALISRGDLIMPATLESLRRQGVLIAGFNNDDPFSQAYPKYVWRHLVEGLPSYDIYFAYRRKNLDEYRSHGCPDVRLLRSYYIRDVHRPLPASQVENAPYESDVTFAGHWENDGRDAYVEPLINSKDISFRLFGATDQWKRSPLYSRICAAQGQIEPKLGEEYNLVLNSTKIGLVFLSKMNNDTYTRRCFEIPATRTMMLSEYSEDLATMFREGVEAEYFRDPVEMMEKIRFYLKDAEARERIAEAGFQRLRADGHEAGDRARTLVEAIHQAVESQQSRGALPSRED